MKIVTEEFAETVENLIKSLQPKDFSHEKERQFSKEHNVLPLGPDLDCDVFLSPKGEVIWTDYGEEFARFNNLQTLIRILFIEKDNFPQLAKFIPNRLHDSKDCPPCQGSGKMKDADGKDMRCLFCAGVGWLTKETYAAILKNR